MNFLLKSLDKRYENLLLNGFGSQFEVHVILRIGVVS